MPSQKWEYKQLTEYDTGPDEGVDQAITDELNGWGEAGWELIAVLGTPGDRRQFFLKKPNP